MAIGALAVPAAAADPRLAFVNGIAGRIVDVCVGNAEVVSRLRFGKFRQEFVEAGDRTVRFRAASPGNCNGNVLAQRTVTLVDDDDMTLVGTARSPQKVVVFDNTPVPVGPGVAGLAIRHAADVAPVAMTLTGAGFIAPSIAPPEWEKGDEIRTTTASQGLIIAASKPNQVSPFEGPKQFNFREGRRTEVILVGSSTRNARFAVVDRANLPV
jgi:hypothetical protein